MEENCYDLDLKYIKGLSADMDDLLTEKGQKEARDFFDFVCWSVTKDLYESFPHPLPSPAYVSVTVPASDSANKSGDVVIVTDATEEDTQLNNMIARFRAVFPRKTRIFNIRKYNLMGGCLGCFGCAVTGKCIYKDNFDEVLRGEIQTAESIVYAFCRCRY